MPLHLTLPQASVFRGAPFILLLLHLALVQASVALGVPLLFLPSNGGSIVGVNTMQMGVPTSILLQSPGLASELMIFAGELQNRSKELLANQAGRSGNRLNEFQSDGSGHIALHQTQNLAYAASVLASTLVNGVPFTPTLTAQPNSQRRLSFPVSSRWHAAYFSCTDDTCTPQPVALVPAEHEVHHRALFVTEAVDWISDILEPVLLFIGDVPWDEIQVLLALPTTLFNLFPSLTTTAVGMLIGDSLLGTLIQRFAGQLAAYLQGLIVRLTCDVVSIVCTSLRELAVLALRISDVIGVIKTLFISEDPSSPPPLPPPFPPFPSPPPFPPPSIQVLI